MGPDFGNYLMGVVGEFALARSLRDIATLFQTFNPVSVPLRKAPIIALAIPERCDATQHAAVQVVASALEKHGAQIVERPAPDALGAEAHQLVGRILAVSMAEWLAAYGIGDEARFSACRVQRDPWARNQTNAGLCHDAAGATDH